MTKSQHLRVTAWPGGKVQPPPVDVYPCHLDGEWLVFEAGHWRGNYRQVPDQVYAFEAADTDPSDPEMVAALVGRIGRLTPMHDLTDDMPHNAEQHAVGLARYSAKRGRAYRPPERVNLLRDGIPMLRVHVDEAGYRLAMLRRLTAHVLAYRQGEPLERAWDMRGLGRYDRGAEAWEHFTLYANAALRAFHVRVWVDAGDRDFNIGEGLPNAYQVAVLQLVNDLNDEVDFKVCAAEGCGRAFLRQRGRSTHYSRTTGVTYCSKSCASAQTQREYRRRKRADNNRR